jgi:multidrug efflux system outer membrane protein
VSWTFPGVGHERVAAAFPWSDRKLKWLAAFCIVASSAGCVLTQDLPNPALAIPQGYKFGKSNDADKPPTLDWWRGFRSRELTGLMEEAQTVNLDIAAAVARFIQADALAQRCCPILTAPDPKPIPGPPAQAPAD